MKIAVIGAGVSGLACAYELERQGMKAVIYEQRHRPGELFDHAAAVLQLFTRPYDPLALLKDEFDLDLQPINLIKSVTMNSPRKKITVKGKLGYFMLRGQNAMSVESQLAGKISSPIVSNTRAEYTSLAKEFDYVVVANGSYDASRAEGIWTAVIKTNLAGGTVIGDFDPTRLIMWVDTRYSKTSYAYLTPMGKKRGFLGLVVPDSDLEEARKHWKLFWEMERLPYHPVSEVVVEHNAGFVYPHQVGNLLFVGIAGGFLESFLGFGLMSALRSGALAGRAIATGRSFEDLLVKLKKDMQHSLVLREIINKAENRDYDIALSVLKTPGLQQLIYNTNIDVVRIGTAAAARFKSLMQRFKSPW